MFLNVGYKIIILAKLLFYVGLSVGIVALVISITTYVENADYIGYATINGGASIYSSLEDSGNKAVLAQSFIGISIAAIISSIFGTLPLYGFGIIVDRLENNTIKVIVDDVYKKPKTEK